VGLLAAACLAGCAGTPAAPPARPPQTQQAVATLPDMTPGYTDYRMGDRVRSSLDCSHAGGTASLHNLNLDTNPNTHSLRAVAVVTITAVGKGHWNTADGHRPNQAEVDALAKSPHKVNGLWPPDWGIYTPLTLSVTRVIEGHVGATVTGWVVGGITAEGDVQSDGTCSWIPGFTPDVGVSAVVFFERELTISDPADTSLRNPLVWLYGYHPDTGLVDLPQGPVSLSKALAG
jgi:hypothetical protein